MTESDHSNESPDGQDDAQFREYLMTVAELHLEPALLRKFDASDVVQQTLLEAHQHAADFRGGTRAEKASWLKQILLHNLIDMMRAFRRNKRDIAKERSLAVSINHSTARLSSVLVAEQVSPPSAAIQGEEGLKLADAMALLPDSQREALVLQHFHGWSVGRIADHMGRSRTAVAGLLKRGLQKLREGMRE